MNQLSIKSAVGKTMLLAAGAVALFGFATITQRAEESAARALETVVTAPGKLYSQPASPIVHLTTVVVTTKRPS